MKPDYTNVDPMLRGFRQAALTYPFPKLTKCRGRLTGEILVIAPRPGAEEIKNGVPLVGDAAQQLHANLLRFSGIDTEDDCFVLPGSVLPKKQSKNLVEPFKSLALKFHVRFKLVLCIGGDNFKFFFGEGKKSSMQTLANGNLIYFPKRLGKIPVFVLPDIDLLAPPWADIKEDEHWKVERMQVKAERWFARILPMLRTHADKLGIKCSRKIS